MGLFCPVHLNCAYYLGEVNEMSRYKSYLSGSLALLLAAATWGISPEAMAVPSFSRQTGMACDACHTSYPGLTQFGREFKLNGYQMDGLKQVAAEASQSAPGLSINKIPNLSVILQVGETAMSKAASGIQNPSANFPKELGFYYAGRIAPHLGTFMQVTYDSGGSLGMDMSDMRYARHATVGGKQMVWGIDMNNGPTFEDPWNSTPGYGFPYVENDATYGPPGAYIASDAVQTNVIGFGAYGYWNNLLYGYAGVYQSAAQGNTPAPKSGNGDVVDGAAPYYRVALTPMQNLEVGSFGFFPKVYINSSSTTARVNDVGVDAQYQMYPNQSNILTFHATYVREKYDPSGTASQTANFLNLDANWIYRHRYGLSVGYFDSTGQSDVSGVAGTSAGEILEADYYPWQNVRFSLQYTAYNKYDASQYAAADAGRKASDNNTILLNGLFGF